MLDDTFDLDMTMMYAVHDAFRRDLALVTRMTARSEGWEAFQTFLRAHHEAEDDALWPVVRKALDGRTDDLALIDEMEAEHGVLEPLLADIDGALGRGEPTAAARPELSARLQEHLAHEEETALPVIDRTLDTEQWLRFGDAAAARVGPDMPVFLPWLLDGADPERAEAILSVLPEPARRSYENEWQPAYAATNRWAT